MIYQIRRAAAFPPLSARWDDPGWASATIAELNHFRPEGSSHRPRTRARLLHNGRAIRGIYHVEDRYVRVLRARYMDEVWKDSCVELFIQPRAKSGYFNVEMNAGGAHLCLYIEDCRRLPGKPGEFEKFTRLPPEIGGKIQVQSSMPKVVDPEITEQVTWHLNFLLPCEVLEHYVGALGDLSGQKWRGNIYKCGDETSHPHWGSWAPVDEFNFHLPRCFETLEFV